MQAETNLPQNHRQGLFTTGVIDSVHSETEVAGQESLELDGVWLDIKEVSRYLHVSRSTLYTWIREGLLPVKRVGRQIRIKREKLDEMIEAGLLDL